MRKIHYFDEGGDAHDSESHDAESRDTPADNTPADSTPASYSSADTSADTSDAQTRADAQATQTALSGLSSLGAFSQATRSPDQQAALDRLSTAHTARDAYNEAYKNFQETKGTEYGLPSYAVLGSPLDQAKMLAQFTQTAPDKWTSPATKNSEPVEHSDLKFTVSPGDLLGGLPDREVLKALSDVGLGNVYGVNNNPNQSAQNVIAAQNVHDFISKAVEIAAPMIPGYGLAKFAANLLSGKMTTGQALASVVGDKVAGMLGVPAPVFNSIYNAEIGNGVAGVATNALNSFVAGVTKQDPRATAAFLSQTPLSSTLKSSLSNLNGGPNVGGAIAGSIDAGLANFGIGKGPAETSANVPYTGMDTQSQIDNILNPRTVSPTAKPVSLDTPASSATPLSSAGTSSGTYAGALSNMSTLGPTGGLYRIGGTGYTPYQQNLAQLNLPADQFTKPSDLGNIPVYNTDIAKMENAPFALPQYAATGGSIRHFNGRDGSYVNADDADAPTADQLEQRAALQAQAQYYKDKEAQGQKDDIMASLKNLSGIGTEMAPPKAQIFHLGQTGNYTPPKVLPQLAALLQARGMHLAEGGQPDDHKHPNYDGTPVFRTGGLSGLGGKYVEGKGDGTSDDITAMLADGEYVFSADVVSALGNGSNKAGAKVLDHTVQAIRERARSAPSDKLPPDAKSPLEYMQSVKGKKHE